MVDGARDTSCLNGTATEMDMKGFLAAVGLAATVAFAAWPTTMTAQEAPKAKAPAQASTVKAGPGQKVCNYRFPDGERRSWACAKEVPCCAWDEIKYVKCGTTWSGCL
jgi:hypothetical protein